MVNGLKLGPSESKCYDDLVARFAPRVIRSRVACARTLERIAEIENSGHPRSCDEAEYLALLKLLVERFQGPPEKPRALVLLRQLLDEHQLRKSDLSRILGKSLSLCSMILSGQRAITKQHAARLGRYFGKGSDLFLA